MEELFQILKIVICVDICCSRGPEWSRTLLTFWKKKKKNVLGQVGGERGTRLVRSHQFEADRPQRLVTAFVVLEIWRRWMCQLVSFPSNFCAHLIKLMAILPRSALCCLWHLQLHLTLPHSQVFPVSIRINCSILPPLLYARHSTVCVRVGYDGFVGSQIWKQPHLSDTQPRWSGYPSALEMRFEMFSPFSNLLLTHALSWHQVSFYLSSSSNPSSPQWQKIRKLTKKQVVSSNIFPRLLFQLYGNLL